MQKKIQSDVLVIGGGLAGIVTAIECLRAGKRVTLVDRDTPERLGGLALRAFGGMALVDTPLQRQVGLVIGVDCRIRHALRLRRELGLRHGQRCCQQQAQGANKGER